MLCPLCQKSNLRFFEIENQEKKLTRKIIGAARCKDCGLFFLKDYKSPRNDLYGENYAAWGKEFQNQEEVISAAKKNAFGWQLKKMLLHIQPRGKKILDLGTGKGYLLEEAIKLGLDVFGLDISQYACQQAEDKFKGRIFHGSLFDADYPDNFFDIVSATDFLEHMSDPLALLEKIKRIVKPGGLFFLITPDTNSMSRKIMGKKWFQYKREHVIYWNKKTLKTLLDKFDFEILLAESNRKCFNLNYYQFYFQKYSLLGLEKIVPFFIRLLPGFIKKLYFNNPITGELLLIAKNLKK